MVLLANENLKSLICLAAFPTNRKNLCNASREQRCRRDRTPIDRIIKLSLTLLAFSLLFYSRAQRRKRRDKLSFSYHTICSLIACMYIQAYLNMTAMCGIAHKQETKKHVPISWKCSKMKNASS